eukprot:GEMP01024631.1.p1 GENE.GEMP01024631.1~~GEMP01024631.1.p1  ORF type:complete len:477 (+),score=126.20 GEMP01024631.1:118-1548(+)
MSAAEAEVDALLEEVDRVVVKLAGAKGAIMRQKFESDLLNLYGLARDKLEASLKGDRKLLVDIYGGDCARISHLVAVIERQSFTTHGSQNDQRTQGCKNMCETVEQVLKDLGFGDRLRVALKKAYEGFDKLVTQKATKKDAALPAGMSVHHAAMMSTTASTQGFSKPLKAAAKNQPLSKEVVESSICQDFTKEVVGTDGLAEFAKLCAPDRERYPGNWLIWMVHRVYLDDPTLDIFDIHNIAMPDPEKEDRIAPKLARSLATNTHVAYLCLAGSNLTSSSGKVMAESLKTNTTVRVLNLDSNMLDVTATTSFARMLRSNFTIEEIRLNNQLGSGMVSATAREIEQEFSEALNTNQTVTKLGWSFSDPHWRNTTDRLLIRNTDAKRKQRNEDRKKAASAAAGALVEETQGATTVAELVEEETATVEAVESQENIPADSSAEPVESQEESAAETEEQLPAETVKESPAEIVEGLAQVA